MEESSTLVHVYEPHRAGLPKLGPYVRELWARRSFAAEMSRATMRAANTRTVFGQVWLVLNPLLLAAVYFVLVDILSSNKKGMEFFAQLTAGLFTFYFVSGSMASGAGSVVGSGKLLMNTAFPRLLLPLSAVRTAFLRYLPTLPVYFLFHFLAGNPITLLTLLSVVFLILIIMFAVGLAAIFATLQVYFRDTSSFLPYVLRIWLYVSPVILTTEQLKRFNNFELINPLYTLLGGFVDLLSHSRMPTLGTWLQATGWAVAALALGSWYLMSRERDFAVRI